MRPKILIVEDEPVLRKHVTRLLARLGFQVVEAESRAQASARLSVDLYSALLLDVRLPDGNGLDLLEDLQRSGVAAPAVLMTADLAPECERRARGLGVARVFHKPFDLLELVASVGELCPGTPAGQTWGGDWGISPSACG